MRMPPSRTLIALVLLAVTSVHAQTPPSPEPGAPPSAAPAACALTGYQWVAGPILVPEVEADLSGISFNPETGTLFAIRNNNAKVFELNREGQLLRAFELPGFEDTEDLVCLGDGLLGIIEERRRTLTVCAIPEGTNAVARPSTVLLIEPTKYGNTGLEGVAYDAADARFYIVKEKEPRRIYSMKRPARLEDTSPVTQPWDLEARSFGVADVSGMAFLPENGHLLLVSDESRCVVECTTDGQEIGRLPLTAGSAGLKADLVQPEGAARDDQGRLYIVCEPNLLYIFKKP